MAVNWTSRGANRFTAWVDGDSTPSGLQIRLTRDVPTWATKVIADLDEIPNGNGYSPFGLSLNTTDWPTETESDTDGNLFLERASKTIVWTASGGTIPSSGDPIKAAVLVESTSPHNVLGYIDLGTSRTVIDGTSLTIPSLALRWAQGRLPAGLGGSVPTSPQKAYLTQASPVQNTWYEVLDYTSGGGVMHQARIGSTTVTNITTLIPEFRFTIDGTESTIEFDSNQSDVISGRADGSLFMFPGDIRFEESLKVEVRKAGDQFATAALFSSVFYSTDI